MQSSMAPQLVTVEDRMQQQGSNSASTAAENLSSANLAPELYPEAPVQTQVDDGTYSAGGMNGPSGGSGSFVDVTA